MSFGDLLTRSLSQKEALLCQIGSFYKKKPMTFRSGCYLEGKKLVLGTIDGWTFVSFYDNALVEEHTYRSQICGI